MTLEQAIQASSKRTAKQEISPWYRILVCHTGPTSYGVSTGKEAPYVDREPAHVMAGLIMKGIPAEREGWEPI